MLDFKRYKVLTFDCYGTLIDWESGILNALRPLLTAHQIQLADDQILTEYAAIEAELEAGAYRPYRQILEGVVEQFGQRFNFQPEPEETAALPDSIQNWLPFEDTVAALRQLQQQYRLVILSNVDDALFAGSAKHLQVAFDDVITAEQIGSYKPALQNFQVMMQRVGLPQDQILHVAQSVHHDIQPASSLGLSTVWVNRRQSQAGAGATPVAEAEADLTIPDLQTLATLTSSVRR
ncbi:MAG: haloacid dehalogenase type II [Pegethrix bostrychoides GSE-TBD4-15B]|jgi:2-haloacid dehalogenase|uniref:Haloacid dehalogenase type II n=1 Tax=Pegethrix bostrychoides GSE-TBD4-15B TaxID=2839662 RepID=A0A951U609_9CYAN|nr:haloacid dehalogenase type II [Pegethrix bostrychoides GSE-TBD4-15B]